MSQKSIIDPILRPHLLSKIQMSIFSSFSKHFLDLWCILEGAVRALTLEVSSAPAFAFRNFSLSIWKAQEERSDQLIFWYKGGQRGLRTNVILTLIKNEKVRNFNVWKDNWNAMINCNFWQQKSVILIFRGSFLIS